MALSRQVRKIEQPFVEWRATSIQDPIEKLTFLRSEATPDMNPPGRSSRRALILGGFLILAFSIFMPTQAVVSDVSPVLSRGELFPDRQDTRLATSFADVWV